MGETRNRIFGIIFILAAGIVMVGGFEGEEIDEFCDTPDSVMVRNNTGWYCLNGTDTYVVYQNAIKNVDLGTYNITANTVKAQNLTGTTNTSSIFFEADGSVTVRLEYP